MESSKYFVSGQHWILILAGVLMFLLSSNTKGLNKSTENKGCENIALLDNLKEVIERLWCECPGLNLKLFSCTSTSMKRINGSFCGPLMSQRDLGLKMLTVFSMVKGNHVTTVFVIKEEHVNLILYLSKSGTLQTVRMW
ncbi:hypothetical protein WICPIJ_009120 [Wickerhamomyces pijperi]|uniref:Uncharacterized protein n=1 Tax=Wickerhamomyces pijperi TaxID=599730 RepID=A0A9P8TF62_WICPI|nr:hypothetical protein WICPIJ_009120 [Wickerhamomyces pijperi]